VFPDTKNQTSGAETETGGKWEATRGAGKDRKGEA